MKNDPDNPAPDRTVDPLDELLQQAQWPNASADPLDQLLRMARWPEPLSPQVSPRRPTKRRMAWALTSAAAAAGLLVAVALWGWRFRGDESSADKPGKVAARLPLEPPKSNGTTVPSKLRPTEAPETSAETERPSIVFAEANHLPTPPAMLPGGLRLQMLLARNEARWQSKEDELLDRTLAQRVVEPGGDLQQLVQPLLAERAEYERRLLERLNTLAGERRLAAIELLGCLGSEASVAPILQLSLRPATHELAVRALLEIADARTLARLARNELDPDLQEEILEVLHARGDEQTLFFALATLGERSWLESGSALRQPLGLP